MQQRPGRRRPDAGIAVRIDSHTFHREIGAAPWRVRRISTQSNRATSSASSTTTSTKLKLAASYIVSGARIRSRHRPSPWTSSIIPRAENRLVGKDDTADVGRIAGIEKAPDIGGPVHAKHAGGGHGRLCHAVGIAPDLGVSGDGRAGGDHVQCRAGYAGGYTNKAAAGNEHATVQRAGHVGIGGTADQEPAAALEPGAVNDCVISSNALRVRPGESAGGGSGGSKAGGKGIISQRLVT